MNDEEKRRLRNMLALVTMARKSGADPADEFLRLCQINGFQVAGPETAADKSETEIKDLLAALAVRVLNAYAGLDRPFPYFREPYPDETPSLIPELIAAGFVRECPEGLVLTPIGLEAMKLGGELHRSGYEPSLTAAGQLASYTRELAAQADTSARPGPEQSRPEE